MDNQSKFCGHCGHPIKQGENFCSSCGAEQQTATPPQSPSSSQLQPSSQPQPTQQPQQQPTQQPAPIRFYQKSNKKLWLAITIPTVIAIIIVVTLAIILNLPGKDRTIMVYMIGSDLESENASASLDITEMKDSNFDPEHTKLLIYTGGTKKWALDDISAEENAIYEIKNGTLTKLQSYEKSLMTEPENLINFVDYAYENYPSDLYDLILWDHGGGPIFGYGSDENSLSGTPMKIPTLAKALSETNLATSGQKFDLVGFDACLMGSTEVAKNLSPYANYMIASEEVEPGGGWNYELLNSLNAETSTQDTKDLGQQIIDSYISAFDDYSYDVDLSLSLIDLNQIDQLTDSVDTLFSKVQDEITDETFSQYSRLMTRDKVYGYTGRADESYDLVDLMDLCSSLSDDHAAEVTQIESALGSAVLYNRTNMDNTNGLSLYFLNFNKSAAERMLVNYKDVAVSDEYYNFLTKYKDFVTGDKKVSKAVYKDLTEEKQDGAIKVELPDELRDNYQSGEIIIFRKLGDNKFMPVYRSSEVQLNGNTLSTTSTNLQFTIEVTEPDGNISYGWSVMAEKERTESYADYVTYGVLYYNDDSWLGFSPKSYEMYIRVPNGSTEGQVRDIRVQSDTDLASKMSFAPDKIKFIDFTVGTYKLYNDAGELDYNMESYGMIYGTEANIEDGDTYKVKLVGLDFDFGDIYDGEFDSLNDYYAEFIVHDTQGDSHRLNLIHIGN